MKLGNVANTLQVKPLSETIKYFRKMGIQTIDFRSGEYAGKAHVDPGKLISDKRLLSAFKETIFPSGIDISVFLPQQFVTNRSKDCGRASCRYV